MSSDIPFYCTCERKRINKSRCFILYFFIIFSHIKYISHVLSIAIEREVNIYLASSRSVYSIGQYTYK